jgi:outer membrane protein assembly factor BamE (lipoprotein component of BamABCDE complex)
MNTFRLSVLYGFVSGTWLRLGPRASASLPARSLCDHVNHLERVPWLRARHLAACLLALTFTLAGAAGCAVTRGDLGAPFKDADIAAVKNGRSTQSDVVRLLGAPDNVIQLGDREAFHYYHYTLKHATFLVFSRVNIASDELYVFFDSRGVVDQVLFSEPTKSLEFQFWPFGA